MKLLKLSAIFLSFLSLGLSINAIIPMDQRAGLPRGDYLNDNRSANCFFTETELVCQNGAARASMPKNAALSTDCINIQYLNDATLGCVKNAISTPQASTSSSPAGTTELVVCKSTQASGPIPMDKRQGFPKGDFLNDNRSGCCEFTADKLFCTNGKAIASMSKSEALSSSCTNIQYLNDATLSCVNNPISTPQAEATTTEPPTQIINRNIAALNNEISNFEKPFTDAINQKNLQLAKDYYDGTFQDVQAFKSKVENLTTTYTGKVDDAVLQTLRDALKTAQDKFARFKAMLDDLSSPKPEPIAPAPAPQPVETAQPKYPSTGPIPMDQRANLPPGDYLNDNRSGFCEITKDNNGKPQELVCWHEKVNRFFIRTHLSQSIRMLMYHRKAKLC